MKRTFLALALLLMPCLASADTPYLPRPGIDPHIPTSITGIRFANGTGADTVATSTQIASALNLSPVVILSTTTGISAFTVANTALYTVPAGKTCVVTGYNVRVTAASSVTAGPAAGVGNASGTNNIAANQTMTGLTSTATTGSTSEFSWPIVGMTTVTPAGGVIYFNLTAIGSPSTGATESLAVDLIGYIY